jgi:hypothetical protein
MKPRLHGPILAYAAIPFLLLTGSREAGIITHVSSDGSGERLVYADAAADRGAEAGRHLRAALPSAEIDRVDPTGDQALAWRDTRVANIAQVGDIEFAAMDVAQQPWSLFSTYTWKETVTYDPGSATDVEKAGVEKMKLRYVVRMPGKVTDATPPAEIDGNMAEWKLDVSDQPQTITVASQSFRWSWLLPWAWVVGFVVYQVTRFVPGAAKRIPRQPRKI